MDIFWLLIKPAFQGYAPYLLGSTVLLGIAIIFVLRKSAPRSENLGHKSREAQPRAPSRAAQPYPQTPIGQERASPVVVSNHRHLPITNGWAGTQLHALIIGIDNYPTLTPLVGAVADAERVAQFLTTELRAPSGNVTRLYNHHASRQAILKGFETLQKNPYIRTGDPIVIFFSGHGGMTNAPPEWKRKHGTNKIQVIFPSDYETPIPNTGRLVNCIPDTTIGDLLNRLAEVKGNNITVIFDSCHSASGTRDDTDRSGLRARSAEVKFDIPPDIDDDILNQSSSGSKRTRGIELPLYSDQASHILIAACGSTQKAWENDANGLFTSALLDTLRRSRVDNITYENLIKALPAIPSQYPHCYGQNKARILFGSRLDVPTKVFIQVGCAFESGRWVLTLQAGEASGVTEHSVWDLHESVTEDSLPYARAVARLPDVLTTRLDIDKQYAGWLDHLANKGPRGAEIRIYARRVRAGEGTELKVWCPSRPLQDLARPLSSLRSVKSPNASNITSEFGYILHNDRNSADVEIDVEPPGGQLTPSSRVVFRLRDPIAEYYRIAELKRRKPAILAEIETVLCAAAKWNWHLQRTNPYPSRVAPIQSMRMVRVATKVGSRREYLDAPQFMEEKPGGLVEFTAKANDLYGIELVSRAKSALYIRIFYFDATDFSIGDVFGHGVAKGSEDAVLPAGGRIVVGDGQDGGSPLGLAISPGNKLEMGYLKVYWCTSPLELSDLAQRSAFEMRPRATSRAVGRAMTMPDWGTLRLTLVLKAP